MFLLKKIIAQFLTPTTVCLEVMIAGMILLLFTRRQRAGKIIITIGICLFTLLSYPAISRMLIRPLEHRYQPLFLSTAPNTANDAAASAARWIVVLGGGHITDPKIPVTSQLSSASLVRTIEAVRLHRKIPGSKLIVSGGKVFDVHPEAETMATLAQEIGVRPEDVVLESESMDTADQAQRIKPIIGNDVFVLVTSAVHIPRAMALFAKLGMRPIPAPTDYDAPERQALSLGDFFPSPGSLVGSHSALHEYLGIIWSWLRRQL
ncbi:MAG: YdcF family protein [Planctomycetes bacterium]|nr:YdcF family protein [Planctomycetota bacterium]